MESTVDNFVVTSVGNSWIVCRSKSHFGRIYYFNTFTGEAAWNLSEAEIEKAKKATKIIENSGVNMDGCPEPNDPPQDNPNHNIQFNKYLEKIPNTGSTKTCNNKIITDKPNQTQFEPHSFSRNQCCNHMNNLNQMGLGYPMTFGLNPNVWNVPTQSVHNNIPSLMNISQHQTDEQNKRLGYNELTYVQSTSIPLNKRFETLRSINHDNDANSSIGKKIKDNHIFIENDYPHENIQDNKIDLRDFISRKRKNKFGNAIDEPIQLFNKSRLINDKILAISKSTDTIDCNQRDVADDNTTIPMRDPEQDSTLIKKDVLLQLKNIAKHIVHKDLWYIVPDVNTFLYHHGFLRSLVESDEECRLMVLDNVMTDIRNTSRSDNIDDMNHARRAMSYISQSIRAGVATIAKDPAAVNNKSKTYILDCCLKLSKENYHIILLCNDKELHNHEKATYIPMFTVNEMKEFFGADIKEEDETRTRTNQHQNNRVMRITIPNNKIGLDTKVPSVKIKPSDDDNIDTAPKTITVSTGTQTNEDLRNNKATIDVGIQANLDKMLTTQTKSTQTSQSPLTTSTLSKSDDSLSNAGLVKRKEIKLNRSLFCQSSKKEDTEKKHFKWRRKRIVFHVENNDTEKNTTGNQCDVSTNNNISKIDNPQKQLDIDKQKESVCNENNFSEDVIVEENLTCGVTSNALANQNAESESNENVHKTTNVNNDENKTNNCFMFEVTSPVVEECLKTRCDEWVSRFLQIMEEVLTQLLQKDSLTSSLCPPWSVHEATQCIKMKYIENRDIVDAADKLSDVLLSCSDLKGKININMSPDQFMTLYSYAVYLIDSLQVIIENSEDLQIASESMAKLLNDIQNPNLDNSQNDSFTDITLETALDVSNIVTSNTDAERNVLVGSRESSTCSPRRELRSIKHLESTPKYNLRSKWKRTFQTNMEGSTSSLIELFRLDNPESQFFRSLHLKKNDVGSENGNTNIPDNASAISRCSATLNTGENEAINDEPSRSEVKPPEDTVQKEPKIIRNFTLFADFEAKIKNKESETISNDLDKIKDNCVEDDFMVDDNVKNHFESNNNSDEELQDKETVEPSLVKNDKLKYVISMLVREIRESFLVVYAFCEESHKRLKGPDAAEDAKRILKTAEETLLIITQLFSSLNRIHNRDVTEMERLFAKFLDSSELKDLKFDENDFQEYRDLIGKCVDQANLLRDSVECIIRYAV